MNNLTGSILRFEYSSMQDGPGLRTVLYFKGCYLRCKWCSTPESQSRYPEKGYLRKRCVLCEKCIVSCSSGALFMDIDQVVCDETRCLRCFKCVSVCPQGAYKLYGKKMTVNEVMTNLLKDEIFFFHSGGGITLSGGEVLLQADFAKEILTKCRHYGIHTAIETSFYAPFEQVCKLLPFLNLLIVDIKHIDGQKHYEWTGVDNKIILENILKADKSPHQFEILVRIPLIPGVNDDDQNLQKTAKFCERLNKIKAIEILPYHRLGVGTYEQLGRPYEMDYCVSLSAAKIKERIDFMTKMAPSIQIKSEDIS